VPAGYVTSVVATHVRSQPPLHHRAELADLFDPGDQVKVIRHHAESEELNCMAIPRLRQKADEVVILTD
jgi:hypothetical protein